MLTLAGAGCIIVVFFLFVGRLGILLDWFGKIMKAMTPILIGCVIAFLLNPIVNRFRMSFREIFYKRFPNVKKKKLNKASDILSVIIAVVFFLAVIAALFWILIPSLYESFNKLYENIDEYSSNIEKLAKRIVKDIPDVVNIYNNYQ